MWSKELWKKMNQYQILKKNFLYEKNRFTKLEKVRTFSPQKRILLNVVFSVVSFHH